MFSDSLAVTISGGVPVLLANGFERSSTSSAAATPAQKRKKSGDGEKKKKKNTTTTAHDAAAAAPTTTPSSSMVKKKAPPLRLSQLSTAEYAANVGARLAVNVPEDEKEARVLEARDYRGIHLYADPQTGVVYKPDDIMAGVIDPRPLDPDLLARLGPWVPSTGLRVAAAAAIEDDDDE